MWVLMDFCHRSAYLLNQPYVLNYYTLTISLKFLNTISGYGMPSPVMF